MSAENTEVAAGLPRHMVRQLTDKAAYTTNRPCTQIVAQKGKANE